MRRCLRDEQIVPWGATVKVDPDAGAIPEIPLLLFSGRLIERKGVDFLLQALPVILKQRQVRLVITGDGHSGRNGKTSPIAWTR